MASTSKNRNRNVLSIEQKVEIISRLNKCESVHSIMSTFKIGKSTVYDLQKRSGEILNFASKLDSQEGSKKRKTMKSAVDEKLEDAVYVWFVQRRSRGDPISGPMLCEKALLFNEKLRGPADFKASTGWLKNFKSRHGIRELEVQGERLSSDPIAAEEFKHNLAEFLENENYSLDDVYNADETGFNWKSLPRKSLASKREKTAPGFKISKQRVTVMVCANASGTHRLPPLMIGKSKKPRCFKNVKCLPLCYKAQKNAWMDTDLFIDWYKNEFIPNVKRFRKEHKKTGRVLLLLDNAPSHPDVELLNGIDKDFEAKYLPPNVTAIIQPMDQGVIEKLKRMYKKAVLRRLLLADDEESVISLSKKLNLKDCCYMLADAWNTLTQDNLRNAWNKLVGKNEKNAENDVNTTETDLNEMTNILFPQIAGFSDCNRDDAQTWLECDNDPGFQILDDDEIVDMVQEEEEDSEREEHDFSDNEEESGPSHAEAFTALETVLSWYEKQDESCAAQLLLLKRMRDLAAKKRCSNLVQKKISEYFH